MSERIIDTDGFNAVVKGKYGYLTYNKNDIIIGRSVEKYGEFSELELFLFQHICVAGDIVIEVGANIGTHTLALAKLLGDSGRIFAFEPQRIVFQTLCANMSINSIKNAECFHAAVSSENGSVLIPDIKYDIEGNFGGVDITRFDQGHRVQKVKLDGFLTLPRLKLIKIDVEGMECEVIRGAENLIEQFAPMIYVENDRQDKSKELIELIWSYGYKAFWHLPPIYNPDNYFGDKENIVPAIHSVNMFCVPKEMDVSMFGLDEVIDSGFHPFKRE